MMRGLLVRAAGAGARVLAQVWRDLNRWIGGEVRRETRDRCEGGVRRIVSLSVEQHSPAAESPIARELLAEYEASLRRGAMFEPLGEIARQGGLVAARVTQAEAPQRVHVVMMAPAAPDVPARCEGAGFTRRGARRA